MGRQEHSRTQAHIERGYCGKESQMVWKSGTEGQREMQWQKGHGPGSTSSKSFCESKYISEYSLHTTSQVAGMSADVQREGSPKYCPDCKETPSKRILPWR